ncbi:MAG: dUTP diphosphatase [Thermoflavifilum sp.]|nr:dUTP diphosphatase [Thermoflavifilum sp.]
MHTLKVRLVNASPFPAPQYATIGAAGLDLRAYIPRPLPVSPGERVRIPTGLFMELPEGYEAQIRPRSGLAWKQGLTVLNAPGTIDSDYRGEIQVMLINLSQEVQWIQPGDRIAQMIIAPYTRVEWVEVQQLSATDRGENGFGHTGKT